MSKEEIIFKISGVKDIIGFEDWKRDNAIVWNGKWGEQYYQKVAGQPLKSNPKNSSELYQLYLNHLQSKATT